MTRCISAHRGPENSAIPRNRGPRKTWGPVAATLFTENSLESYAIATWNPLTVIPLAAVTVNSIGTETVSPSLPCTTGMKMVGSGIAAAESVLCTLAVPMAPLCGDRYDTTACRETRQHDPVFHFLDDELQGEVSSALHHTLSAERRRVHDCSPVVLRQRARLNCRLKVRSALIPP